MANLASRNKPRSPLVLLLRQVLCRAGAGKLTLVERVSKIWSKTAKTPRGPSEVLRSTRAKCNETELAQREPRVGRSLQGRLFATKLAQRCRSSLKIVLLQCCALRRKDSIRAGHVYCLRSCFAEYQLLINISATYIYNINKFIRGPSRKTCSHIKRDP